MAKRLVTSDRESDGKFALKLESNAAVLRDQMREEARRKRAAQVVEENAEWCKQMGFDPNEAQYLFL